MAKLEKILVVEDDLGLMINASEGLANQGVQIHPAFDLEDATSILERESIDGVITDLNYCQRGLCAIDREYARDLPRIEQIPNLRDALLRAVSKNEEGQESPAYLTGFTDPKIKNDFFDQLKKFADGSSELAEFFGIEQIVLGNWTREQFTGSAVAPLGIKLGLLCQGKNIPYVMHTAAGHSKHVLPLLSTNNVIDINELTWIFDRYKSRRFITMDKKRFPILSSNYKVALGYDSKTPNDWSYCYDALYSQTM